MTFTIEVSEQEITNELWENGGLTGSMAPAARHGARLAANVTVQFDRTKMEDAIIRAVTQKLRSDFATLRQRESR